MTKEIDVYLDGQEIYGDDFDAEQIAEWHADERVAYSDLLARQRNGYLYPYHAWNWFHAYSNLAPVNFPEVLGFGSAYGDEFLPIIARIQRLTIVDPSPAFVSSNVHGVPATYVHPKPDGRLPLHDAAFDLITCFGALHHIPNVTFVLGELARTLKPGSTLLLREPIVSMGDWRRPRTGLTKRERGIPLELLKSVIAQCGLDVVRCSLCDFPLTRYLFRPFSSDVFNNRLAVWVDAALAASMRWNLRYHARNMAHRLRPSTAFFLLRKPVQHAGNS